tara:strand:+ start:5206 stop:5610 length:405 start_codon:yes stop_codon:yes gene_type:complete
MTDGTIDHIGIATSSLDESQQLWSILGFTQGEDQINSEEGVKIRFMNGNTSTRIELLEPLGDDTPVGKFISKYGPGIQQIAVRVADIEETISVLLSVGVKMVSETPTLGADGHRIAFIHPSSAGGVLIELVESD